MQLRIDAGHQTELTQGLLNFLPRVASSFNPPFLHLPGSWDYMLSHNAWLVLL
jgi:hypothetical protein